MTWSTPGQVVCSNPSMFPDQAAVVAFEEPVIRATIISPAAYMGDIITLCQSRSPAPPPHTRRARAHTHTHTYT